MHSLQLGIFATVLASFLSSGLFAQSTFGSINGTVTDPSGAIVPGAQVQVINEDTGFVRRTQTTSAGVFNVPNLDLGIYRVRVDAAGFTSFERGELHLAANQIINLNIQLSLGNASTVVQVKSATPEIATEASDVSGSLSNQELQKLPLVGEHDTGSGGIYTYVGLTTAGSVPSGGGLPTIQGTRTGSGIMPTMDGMDVMSFTQGAGVVQPGWQAIQELKIETNVAPAEFATSGNIQVVTQSGTNQFHGQAYEIYNGNHLNSRSFFANNVPFRAYNNFGLSLSGPIRKDKLFFFVDYDGSREAAQQVLTESVPLPAWRNGNFSTYSNQIIDPSTGKAFPGNVIPQSRLSPVSQNIQNYAYPLPNTGVAGSVANNWTENVPGTTGFTIYDDFDTRIDYNIDSNDTLFGRVSWRRAPLTIAGIYPLYRQQTRWGESAVLSWNHIFAPNLVNEFRTGVTYNRNYYHANVVGSNLLSQFGITGVPNAGIATAPEFSISGVTAWDPNSSADIYVDDPETTLEWIDNLEWTHGRHQMKFGFDAIRDRLLGNNIGTSTYGNYTFSGTYTGFGYSDFLLGIPQQTTLSIPSPNRDLRGVTWGLYGQDRLQLTPNLTLNYGIRWELEGPDYDARGALYSFDPVTGALVVPNSGMYLINPLYPKDIPLETASQAGYPARSLLNMNNMIQPRVGFAWRPFGGDKTVVRGGYGIYGNLIYVPIALFDMTGGPFAGSVTFINAVKNGVPLFSFPSPFLASVNTGAQNVTGVNPGLKTPYTQQWELSVERQLAGVGLRVSYVGSRSDQLVYARNLNQPVPSTTPFSTTEYFYPSYTQITYLDSGGNDSYNALQIEAHKNYGRNLTFDSGFTWAKDLTDTPDNNTFNSLIQNQFDRAAERGNNALVVPLRFYLDALYALPIGSGQRFFSNANGILQQLLGGWRTSWVLISQAGQYFTPSFSGPDPSNTGVSSGRPDVVPGVSIYPAAGQTLTEWFNPAAFSIPGCPANAPVCTNPANVGRFGNAGVNILEGPSLMNLDFGLEKDFHVLESSNLEFLATMQNVLNHPNFGLPAANISAPGTVGHITGTVVPLLSERAFREIDLSLRLTF